MNTKHITSALAVILILTSRVFALTYEQAKEALLALDKLKAEQIITGDEYAKRRQSIVETIDGQKGALSSAKAPASGNANARTFESKHFSAKLKRVQILKSGEVSIAIDYYKAAGDSEVVLRLNDGLSAVFKFEDLANTLVDSSGAAYRNSGITGLRTWSENTPPSLSEKSPTTVTYQFKRAGFSEKPSNITFTINAEVAVFVRSDAGQNYSRAGNVSVHFDEIR